MTSLTITGGDQADALTIDATAASLPFAIGFDGGDGSDSLTGPNTTNVWLLNGVNAGQLLMDGASPIGGAGTVDYAAVENLAGGTALDVFTFGTGSVTGGITDSGPVDINIGGFIAISGTVTFGKQTVGVTHSGPGTQAGVSLLTFSLTSGTLFVGAEGGTDSATGFEGTISSLAVALFSYDDAVAANDRTWYAVKGTISGGIVGISGLTADVKDLTVDLNSRDDTSDTFLDLTQLDTDNDTTFADTLSVGGVALNYTTAKASAGAVDSRLAVGGFVLAHGGFTLDRRLVDVDTDGTAGAELVDASLLRITLTGAGLFVGTGAAFDDATTPGDIGDDTIVLTNAVGFDVAGPVARARDRQAEDDGRRPHELPRPAALDRERGPDGPRRRDVQDQRREGEGQPRQERGRHRDVGPAELGDGVRRQRGSRHAADAHRGHRRP